MSLLANGVELAASHQFAIQLFSQSACRVFWEEKRQKIQRTKREIVQLNNKKGFSMGTGSIIPTIRYSDCPAAIEWLRRAFCFESHFIVPGEGGEILHAQLTCGESMIMLGSAHDDDDFGKLHASPSEIAGKNTSSFYMVVEDADEHCANARKHGAVIVMDVRDEDYGGRGYTCRDLEGHIWTFGTYDPWSEPGDAHV